MSKENQRLSAIFQVSNMPMLSKVIQIISDRSNRAGYFIQPTRPDNPFRYFRAVTEVPEGGMMMTQDDNTGPCQPAPRPHRWVTPQAGSSATDDVHISYPPRLSFQRMRQLRRLIYELT